MARWNHNNWIVAAHPFVDGDCVMTVGFADRLMTSRSGSPFRGYRIDAGGETVARGLAFVDDGRIAIRLDRAIAGVRKFDFAVDGDNAAVPGTGRMLRDKGWEDLHVLPG